MLSMVINQVIPAPGKPRQEDHEYKTTVGYTVVSMPHHIVITGIKEREGRRVGGRKGGT